MNSRIYTGLIALLVVTGIACSSRPAEDRELISKVPLINLLSDPEKIIDEKISTTGFLEVAGSLNLYLTRDHANIFDNSMAVMVHDTSDGASLSQSPCVGKYVSLEGTLTIIDEFRTHAIRDTQRVIDMESGRICWTLDHN